MRVNKKSNLIFGRQDINKYFSDLDIDVKGLFKALMGRVRFGDGDTGENGENIAGQFVQFTSAAVANTEFNVSHSIGSVPVGYITLWSDKACSIYQGPSTGTAWTASQISLKCNVTSATVLVFLIK